MSCALIPICRPTSASKRPYLIAVFRNSAYTRYIISFSTYISARFLRVSMAPVIDQCKNKTVGLDQIRVKQMCFCVILMRSLCCRCFAGRYRRCDSFDDCYSRRHHFRPRLLRQVSIYVDGKRTGIRCDGES